MLKNAGGFFDAHFFSSPGAPIFLGAVAGVLVGRVGLFVADGVLWAGGGNSRYRNVNVQRLSSLNNPVLWAIDRSNDFC